MIQKLLTDLQTIASDYFVTYEEAKMMNLTADTLQRYKGFVYIEEYRQGTYTAMKYGDCEKTTKIDVYFCKFAQMHSTALEREKLRSAIETESVKSTIQYLQNTYNIKSISFACPVPRFDANEVSICLTFQLTQELCF